MGTDDDEALRRRVDAGTLTWRGPALMLFARAVFAVAAQSACRGYLRATVVDTLLYLRLRRLVPFAIAHALMDGASVLIGVLLPQLKV